MTVRIAVLLACYNRRDVTLGCLERLEKQDVPAGVVDTVVVDDASTDGTAAAIAERYPEVTVVHGTGDLFWVGGMRLAFAHAARGDYDHYLLLNDDTHLDPDALARLLRTHDALRAAHKPCPIVVGSTRDPDTGRTTYGGLRRAGGARRLHFEVLVEPDAPGGEPRECETMNTNCVLVPCDVVARIGFFNKTFTQSFADIDYGLRARQAGCSVWVAPGTVGTCARNPPLERLPLRQELRRLTALKGGLPPREWVTFARDWAGPLWPVYALSPYVRRLGARLAPRSS